MISEPNVPPVGTLFSELCPSAQTMCDPSYPRSPQVRYRSGALAAAVNSLCSGEERVYHVAAEGPNRKFRLVAKGSGTEPGTRSVQFGDEVCTRARSAEGLRPCLRVGQEMHYPKTQLKLLITRQQRRFNPTGTALRELPEYRTCSKLHPTGPSAGANPFHRLG